MKPWIAGTIGGGLALTALQMLVGSLMPLQIPPMPPSTLWWLLGANGLIAVVFTAIARHARWSGWRLAAALFAVFYVVNTFTGLIEAVFFDIFGDRREVLGLMRNTALVAALFTPLLVLLAGRWRAAPPEPLARPGPIPHLPLKLFGCAVLYVVLYFAFGTLIYPYIHEFYEQRTLPGPLAIIAMQLLVRGPLLAAMVLLVTRMTQRPAAVNALFGALVMSVVGGLAPLMVPNPYFPDAIRIVHLFEVTTENFIFGWVAGWLFSVEPAGAARARASATRA